MFAVAVGIVFGNDFSFVYDDHRTGSAPHVFKGFVEGVVDGFLHLALVDIGGDGAIAFTQGPRLFVAERVV